MLYDVTVPQFIKMLRNLNFILGKAAAHAETKKFDFSVLLRSRLYPDQFDLIKQVQIACDAAKFCGARLSGKDAPVHDDKETTWPELKVRIESTVQFLSGLTAENFKGGETRKISQMRWEGKWMNGEEYAIQYAIPNVYFHITTAYSILRHNGVEIGKSDYLGELPFKK